MLIFCDTYNIISEVKIRMAWPPECKKRKAGRSPSSFSS